MQLNQYNDINDKLWHDMSFWISFNSVQTFESPELQLPLKMKGFRFYYDLKLFI